jgi:hypothetical protein
MTDPTPPDAPRASQKRPGYLDPATVTELQRLARSRPRSGRGQVAKASAIRTLERLERSRSRRERPMSVAAIRLFDEHRDPNEPTTADDWFPEGDPEFRALYDGIDTVGERRRWYRNLEHLGRI